MTATPPHFTAEPARLIDLHGELVDDAKLHRVAAWLKLLLGNLQRSVVNMLEVQPGAERHEQVLAAAFVRK